ncbi:MAG: hypothetical protein AAB453_00825 [Patescibacteria group bacterium]|mgnify:CR=1 FL=1
MAIKTLNKNIKRISISPDRQMARALKASAKMDGVQITTKATMLIRLALELEEDMLWAKIAEERRSTSTKMLSYDEIKKKFF